MVAVTLHARSVAAGVNYVPKWTEWAASVAVFTAAVVAFRLAVLYLPIFPRVVEPPRAEAAWSGEQVYGWQEQSSGVLPQVR